ncbi:MAG TPA: CoA-binding protein [Tenuifilaceae bacterium]|nr:CoA-binding protein [Tenuifilaceae bacterium]HPE17329.1 CoA-binding protein [Tenuifilaceae bacterium]HPJ44555.1 CoA-binding protein [Tenuifilaceae bacterium]HPQ34862.1 CoA-binding protein [Tenuifilaceae bacterium]HRX67637.1 CoA-binding protein [Tenuifilaceae bacterium]
MNKKTLVLGASTRAGRFSYLAIKSLVKHGVEVVAVGMREGNVEGVNICTYPVFPADIHTVTLYLNPENQKQYLEYILSLKPKRIIFNPGTENPDLLKLARENGIDVLFDCTLVMLSAGRF